MKSDPLPIIALILVIGSGIGVLRRPSLPYLTTDELIPSSCAGQNHKIIFSPIAGVVPVILLGLL